jgi:hypothetical protein
MSRLSWCSEFAVNPKIKSSDSAVLRIIGLQMASESNLSCTQGAPPLSAVSL